MRKTNQDIEQKVEQTLKSLDKIKRNNPKPFFYTRFEAKLANEPKINTTRKTVWQWGQLAWFMLFFLVLNLATIIFIVKKTQNNPTDTLIETYGLESQEFYDN